MIIDEQPTCEWSEKIEGVYNTCKTGVSVATWIDPANVPCLYCGARIVVVKESAA